MNFPLGYINILFVELLCWQEVVLGSSQENIFENARWSAKRWEW